MSSFRFERKYIIQNANLKDLVLNLKMLPQGFKETYKTRKVNSVYFDTPDLQSYENTIDGVPEKAKVRIRWYNDAFEKANLEIKVKKGSVGKKLTFDLEGFSLEKSIRIQYLNALKKSDVPADVKTILKDLMPVTYNHFKRKYFVSFDQDFRITLDYEMEFTRILSSKIRKGRKHKADFMIMEIKYQNGTEQKLSEITENLPFRISRFSKFSKGVVSL